MEIKIEKGIPAPKRNGEIYPFPHMEIGDSFYVKEEGNIKKLHLRLSAASNLFVKRNKLTWVFRTKRIDGGIRIWRIK